MESYAEIIRGLKQQVHDLECRLAKAQESERRERQRADLLEQSARQAWRTAIIPKPIRTTG